MSARHSSLILITLLIAVIVLAPGTGYAQDDATGRIAIVGADGNIHLYDLASDTFTQLTSDAIANAKVYAWPTWSTDGQLAYFGVNAATPPLYSLGIFVQPVNGDAVRVFDIEGEVFTYAYWSPGDCPTGNCRDLAVLYTMRDGTLAVRRVRSQDMGAEFSVEDVAEGMPFYWDWSPDGQSMFWARYNSELSIYDVASDSITQTFEEVSGYQRAVDWSPVDDRLLSTVVTDLRESSLVIFDGEQRITLAEKLNGVVSFEWSPDGTHVAYTNGDGGDLTVMAAQAGAEQTQIADNVVGFFWSPDGSKIAYITLTREGNDQIAKRSAQSTPVIRWHVYNTESGSSQRLASFLPSRDMLYYLQFYDQFARSHRIWSPDSRYIVYGELLSGSRSVVSLLDTETPSAAPETLMAGSIGVFAWE